MTASAGFEAEVDGWIRAAIGESSLTFGELVAALPGVDPTFVQERLRRASSRIAARVRWAAVQARPPWDRRLPVPHPLDYDWRFTQSTIAALNRELVASNGAIALMGVPSLWMSLRRQVGASRLHLFDANPLVELGVADGIPGQVIAVDLLAESLPQVAAADTAVADPPWYPESLHAFLWAAASVTRLGGEVWLSAPPLGTRPGMVREREELMVFALACGLSLRSLRPGGLRYATPPFERAALRAAGLLDYVPDDWRQGDLYVFERVGAIMTPRPVVESVPWVERVLKGVRIRVKVVAASVDDDPMLLPIVNGDIFRSVSRRAPLRDSVRVWTSGNRVFGCRAPARLVEVLDALVVGRAVLGRDAALCRTIEALVDRERAEYICSDDG